MIDDEDGSADKIGALTVDLDGEFFGVDFNPAANARRVVSDTGQNLRRPFATMPLAVTVEDGDLTNPAVAPATDTVDAEGVSGAAYTNNDLDATTATTLFDLDTALNRVALPSPANARHAGPDRQPARRHRPGRRLRHLLDPRGRRDRRQRRRPGRVRRRGHRPGDRARPVVTGQRPYRTAAFSRAFAASTARSFGGAEVTSESSSSRVAASTARTARS